MARFLFNLFRWLITAVLTGLALIPFWIWLLVYNLLGPKGFWEKLVIYGLGAWFLGMLQLVLIVLLLIALAKFWIATSR
jgi:hypothetical protein